MDYMHPEYDAQFDMILLTLERVRKNGEKLFNLLPTVGGSLEALWEKVHDKFPGDHYAMRNCIFIYEVWDHPIFVERRASRAALDFVSLPSLVSSLRGQINEHKRRNPESGLGVSSVTADGRARSNKLRTKHPDGRTMWKRGRGRPKGSKNT